MDYYKKTEVYWNTLFNDVTVRHLKSHKSGYEALDKALDWLSEGSTTTLDFGSGSGALLAFLAMRKPGAYYGIDLSASAIDLAKRLFAHNDLKTGHFQVGSIDALSAFKAQSFDAIILSNILDNLTEGDALKVLEHTDRLLRPKGKLFIKLNPYYEPKVLAETKDCIDTDLYLEPNGLYLWNKSDPYWLKQLEKDYTVIHHSEIYLTEAATNRLFLCIKKSPL